MDSKIKDAKTELRSFTKGGILSTPTKGLTVKPPAIGQETITPTETGAQVATPGVAQPGQDWSRLGGGLPKGPIPSQGGAGGLTQPPQQATPESAINEVVNAVKFGKTTIRNVPIEVAVRAILEKYPDRADVLNKALMDVQVPAKKGFATIGEGARMPDELKRMAEYPKAFGEAITTALPIYKLVDPIVSAIKTAASPETYKKADEIGAKIKAIPKDTILPITDEFINWLMSGMSTERAKKIADATKREANIGIDATYGLKPPKDISDVANNMDLELIANQTDVPVDRITELFMQFMRQIEASGVVRTRGTSPFRGGQ